MADRKLPIAIHRDEECSTVGSYGITRMEWGRIKGPMDWLDTILVYRGDTLVAEHLAYRLDAIQYEPAYDINGEF